MPKIITYMLGLYLVVKSVEVLQIGLASNRSSRVGLITLGILTLLACVIASGAFVYVRDRQALSMNQRLSE